MPPLTRQPTLQSIHSWWSDSNPVGATISLHAAAKPLLRAMYHRQALSLIRQNDGIRLSKTTADIYSSYLTFKYVSLSTKAAVLMEFERRTGSREDRHAVVNSFVFGQVAELLESPSKQIRRWTCHVVGNLADDHTTAASVIDVAPCVQLVALLRDQNVKVVQGAIYALAQITQWSKGAQAAMEAKMQYRLCDLLSSPDTLICRWTAVTLGRLAARDSSVITVLDSRSCAQLVYLLQDQLIQVNSAAMFALAQITQSRDAAWAAVDANVLHWLGELLESPNASVRRWTSWNVGRLVSHQCTVVAVMEMNPCVRLVSLLRDQDVQVVEGAIYALSQITQWPEGTEALVDAKLLHWFDELLESPNIDVRRWMADTLASMATSGRL